MARRKFTPAGFWSKVDKSGECWLWTGASSSGGYGCAYPKGKKSVAAHRVSWMLTFGEIPAGVLVCHRCDVPACVRPDHLFLGTDLTNAQDREQKKRGVLAVGKTSGENNLNSKLTAAIVLKLRAEDRVWVGSKRKLHLQRALDYGVSETCIREAIKGKTKWVNL